MIAREMTDKNLATHSGYWEVVKLWPNSTVFIVGGGASLNTTGLMWSKDNAETILKSVSDNLSIIHDKRVIGVNNAFELGDWVDICFFGDERWLGWNRHKLVEFPGLVVCNVPVSGGEWVHKLHRNEQPGIDTRPTHCCWNKNSGCAAINLAALLGAKVIVLIGFDMDVDKETGQHDWHKMHKIENNPGYNTPYVERFLPSMPAIKRDCDKLGVNVINTSMNSAIEEFEKMSLREAVKTFC